MAGRGGSKRETVINRFGQLDLKSNLRRAPTSSRSANSSQPTFPQTFAPFENLHSFLKGFSKKPYRTSDQSKLIFDFLAFISAEMRKCAVWSKASEAEFANADEAMEKLIMNRLYAYTFAPAVKKEGKRSVQTDDLERDRVLSQRAEMFSWVKEEHLDVPKGDHSKGFLEFAMQGE